MITGHGLNPQGDTEGFVARLDDPDPVQARLVPFDPDGTPSLFDLYVDCGEFSVKQLDVGIVMRADFDLDTPTDFNFGGCTDPDLGTPGRTLCTGATLIGPTISTDSFYDGPALDGTGVIRDDTAYLQLYGDGPATGLEICMPGESDVYAGRVTLPVKNPELIVSYASASVALDIADVKVPDAHVRLEREPDLTGAVAPARFGIRPALDDTDGTEWEAYITSDTEWAKLSFGVIIPPGLNDLFFADCQTPSGSYNERACASNEFMGAMIDHTQVRTLGPDPFLEDECGLRGDTLYVYIAGLAESGDVERKLNVAGIESVIGRLTMDSANPARGWNLALTLENLDLLSSCSNDTQDWTLPDGSPGVLYSVLGGTGHDGGSGSDSDGDGVVDTSDNCEDIGNPNQEDDGTVLDVTADGIGNVCQCLEVDFDLTVVQNDIDIMRQVMLGLQPPSAMADPSLCNGTGPVGTAIDPDTGLPMDCNLNDVYVALRALRDQAPVIPSPGEDPVCPDMSTP